MFSPILQVWPWGFLALIGRCQWKVFRKQPGLKWSLNQWFVRNTQRGQWISQATRNDDQNQPGMTATWFDQRWLSDMIDLKTYPNLRDVMWKKKMHWRIKKKKSQPLLPVGFLQGWRVESMGPALQKPSLGSSQLSPDSPARGIALARLLRFMATIAAAARRDLKAIKAFYSFTLPWDKLREPFSRPGSNFRATGGGASVAQVGETEQVLWPRLL